MFMASPTCRDILLSHYVPGFRQAKANVDVQTFRDVQIDMHDLSLFSAYACLYEVIPR